MSSNRERLYLMKPLSAIISGAILLSVSSLPCPAQVFNPPPPSGGGSTSGGSTGGGSPSTTTVNNQSQQSSSKPMLGNEVPFLDPSTGILSADGKNADLANNPLLRARYEKYLSSPASSGEEHEAYRNVIRQLLDELSPHNKPNMARAIALLQNAAGFEQDSRLCESLANTVYRIYLAEKNARDLEDLNRELDNQRRRLDWDFDNRNDPNALSGNRRKLKSDPKAKQQTVDPKGAGTKSRILQRITEIEAQRVANRAQMELSRLQSKVEFQALIVQFAVSRRFEHVVMGCRIYTEFYADGDGALSIDEDSDLSKTFTKSVGFSPTISSLDAFANEAIRDVKQSVEAFSYLLDKGQVDGANRQLQQAFVTGEFLPPVQHVPLEKKQMILGYAQAGFALLSALEVRDYTLAEDKINEMRELASDFDYAKPRAAIETAKVTANMHIRNAKNAMLKGDEQGAADHIRQATEIWPTNPELTRQFNMMSDVGDVQLQAKIEFDQMLSTQRYRQIYNDRGRLAVAVYDDEDRRRAFEEIIGNIQEIETVLKQADALKNGGNAHAAWELVEKTFEKFNDDVPLSAKRSDLSTEVADFVRSVKKAQQLEEDQPGSSLAWFLKSRELYPQSEYAAEGIERIVDKILPSDGGFGAESSSASSDDGFFGN